MDHLFLCVRGTLVPRPPPRAPNPARGVRIRSTRGSAAFMRERDAGLATRREADKAREQRLLDTSPLSVLVDP